MQLFFKYRNYFLIGGVIVSFFLASSFFLMPKEESVSLVPVGEKEEIELVQQETAIYKVDIKGAVVAPGVYSLEEGSRVSDAIQIAGGMTEHADSSTINLSKKIEDEMVIFVLTKEEVKEETEASLKKEVSSITNGALYDSNKIEGKGKVSINHATLEELTSLSGIGNSKAQAIISYRTEKGGFQSIEEIMEVRGIGESLFAKIKEDITL